MIRVGLIGEDPNDTFAIKNLLEKKYKGKVQFFQLLAGIRAYHLDNLKLKRRLPIEAETKNCKLIVFIRDLG